MPPRSHWEDVPAIYLLTYHNPGSDFDGFIYVGQTNSFYARMRSYRADFAYSNTHAAWWVRAIQEHDGVYDFDKYFTQEIIYRVPMDKHDPQLKTILNALEIAELRRGILMIVL